MLPETKSKRTFVFRKYYEKYKHLWILLYFSCTWHGLTM